MFAGIFMTITNTSANSLLQATAPARIRGQTVSLYMLVMRGGRIHREPVDRDFCAPAWVRHALALNRAIAVVAHVFIGRRWLGRN